MLTGTARTCLLAFLLVAATIAIYANSFTASFHLDDVHFILDRDVMSSAETYLSTHISRPFAALTFWLNAQVAQGGPYDLRPILVTGGLVPLPFHVVNLAIHIAAGLTLFGLVRWTLGLPSLSDPPSVSASAIARRPFRLLPAPTRGSADGLAFAIALLWLVHPLNTMAVTYITQRCESMMGMFYLLTLYCYLRASQSPEPRLWQLLSILAALCGSATKEVMITLPAVLIVYDRTVLAADWLTVLRRRGGYLLGLTAACWMLPVFVHVVVVSSAERDASAVGGGALVTPWNYLLAQSTVLAHYLRLSVWPSDLSVGYRDWPAYEKWTSVWPYLVGILLALAGTTYGVVRGRWYGFLGTCFFAVLSLTSSVLPIIDFVEEYRMYLPLAAVIAGLVVVGDRLLALLPHARLRQVVGVVLVVGLAAALGVRTRQRNADYETDITLWTRNLETRPDDAKANMHLAIARERLGEYAEAERLYRTAINQAWRQFLPSADQNLSALLLLHGNERTDWRNPFGFGPSLETRYYRAILQADRGDLGGAMLEVADLDDKLPRRSAIKMLAAQLLAELGRTKESEEALDEALAIFPGYGDYVLAKTKVWLKTPYFANPIGRRITLAFAQQAVMATRGRNPERAGGARRSARRRPRSDDAG